MKTLIPTTAQGKLIFGIMARLAEFERALIAERVKTGMARAKAQGKHIGSAADPATEGSRDSPRPSGRAKRA